MNDYDVLTLGTNTTPNVKLVLKITMMDMKMNLILGLSVSAKSTPVPIKDRKKML